ncbi:transforming acidic coiled-coil-containing protein 3-like isoform X2 [Limulus polyphemus]|uniref:Transforming acidic coiled-coil-containing protein 3-like isoform X2 n=1 Tax=Limulus polyphemus TaxID=6850 RepID=A0ABM1B3G3_LIMPO|nr:transforming acidic coiled-coil-containing protein 3-like isoform X2 [Limulus polyphemus]
MGNQAASLKMTTDKPSNVSSPEWLKFVRELDEAERWKERNVTSQDHQENIQVITNLLDEVIENLPLERVVHPVAVEKRLEIPNLSSEETDLGQESQKQPVSAVVSRSSDNSSGGESTAIPPHTSISENQKLSVLSSNVREQCLPASLGRAQNIVDLVSEVTNFSVDSTRGIDKKPILLGAPSLKNLLGYSHQLCGDSVTVESLETPDNISSFVAKSIAEDSGTNLGEDKLNKTGLFSAVSEPSTYLHSHIDWDSTHCAFSDVNLNQPDVITNKPNSIIYLSGNDTDVGHHNCIEPDIIVDLNNANPQVTADQPSNSDLSSFHHNNIGFDISGQTFKTELGEGDRLNTTDLGKFDQNGCAVPARNNTDINIENQFHTSLLDNIQVENFETRIGDQLINAVTPDKSYQPINTSKGDRLAVTTEDISNPSVVTYLDALNDNSRTNRNVADSANIYDISIREQLISIPTSENILSKIDITGVEISNNTDTVEYLNKTQRFCNSVQEQKDKTNPFKEKLMINSESVEKNLASNSYQDLSNQKLLANSAVSGNKETVLSGEASNQGDSSAKNCGSLGFELVFGSQQISSQSDSGNSTLHEGSEAVKQSCDTLPEERGSILNRLVIKESTSSSVEEPRGTVSASSEDFCSIEDKTDDESRSTRSHNVNVTFEADQSDVFLEDGAVTASSTFRDPSSISSIGSWACHSTTDKVSTVDSDQDKYFLKDTYECSISCEKVNSEILEKEKSILKTTFLPQKDVRMDSQTNAYSLKVDIPDFDENINPFQSQNKLENSPLPVVNVKATESNMNMNSPFSVVGDENTNSVQNSQSVQKGDANENIVMHSACSGDLVSDQNILAGGMDSHNQNIEPDVSPLNAIQEVTSHQENVEESCLSSGHETNTLDGSKASELKEEFKNTEIVWNIEAKADRSKAQCDRIEHNFSKVTIGSKRQNGFRPSEFQSEDVSTECSETFLNQERNIFSCQTVGSIPYQSDSGSEVLQFTEEEFRSAAEFFKDPAAFEFLQKAGNSKALKESALARLSLYVKFDPLLTGDSSVKKQQSSSHLESLTEGLGEETPLQHTRESNPDTVATEGNDKQGQPSEINKLIDFSPSPKKKVEESLVLETRDSTRSSEFCHTSQEHKTFNEEEVNQALKIHDLLYQEKLIKKDKEWNERFKALEKKKHILGKQVASLKDALTVNRMVASELASLVDNFLQQKENERIELGSSNQKLTKERDQALEDLQSVENAFADLHRRYEKTKSVVEGYKQNEEWLKQQLSETQAKLNKQEQMYEVLRNRTEEKLESANIEIENTRKSSEGETAALVAQLKKAEMRICSLERNLEHKTKENTELSNICDELIAKVGKI